MNFGIWIHAFLLSLVGSHYFCGLSLNHPFPSPKFSGTLWGSVWVEVSYVVLRFGVDTLGKRVDIACWILEKQTSVFRKPTSGRWRHTPLLPLPTMALPQLVLGDIPPSWLAIDRVVLYEFVAVAMFCGSEFYKLCPVERSPSPSPVLSLPAVLFSVVRGKKVFLSTFSISCIILWVWITFFPIAFFVNKNAQTL